VQRQHYHRLEACVNVRLLFSRKVAALMVVRERETVSTMMSNLLFSAQSLHRVMHCTALHCGTSDLDNVGEVVAASSHCLQGLVQESKVHCADVQQTDRKTAEEKRGELII
jgi:hypothetical protein